MESKKPEQPKKAASVCWLCGEDRKLRKHLDHEVCATCAYVMSTAKSRPEALRKALERFGPQPPSMSELSEPVWVHGKIEETSAEPQAEILARIDLLEETTNARIDILERIAKQIGSLAGLAGLVTSEAKKINCETVQHFPV